MTFKTRLVRRRISRVDMPGARSSDAASNTSRLQAPRGTAPPPETLIHRYDYLRSAVIANDPPPLPVPHMYSS